VRRRLIAYRSDTLSGQSRLRRSDWRKTTTTTNIIVLFIIPARLSIRADDGRRGTRDGPVAGAEVEVFVIRHTPCVRNGYDIGGYVPKQNRAGMGVRKWNATTDRSS